jgi:hypothetical protein
MASSQPDRAAIGKEIHYELVHRHGVRFLKRDPIFSTWSVAKAKVGRDKISHCLRATLHKIQNGEMILDGENPEEDEDTSDADHDEGGESPNVRRNQAGGDGIREVANSFPPVQQGDHIRNIPQELAFELMRSNLLSMLSSTSQEPQNLSRILIPPCTPDASRYSHGDADPPPFHNVPDHVQVHGRQGRHYFQEIAASRQGVVSSQEQQLFQEDTFVAPDISTLLLQPPNRVASLDARQAHPSQDESKVNPSSSLILGMWHNENPSQDEAGGNRPIASMPSFPASEGGVDDGVQHFEIPEPRPIPAHSQHYLRTDSTGEESSTGIVPTNARSRKRIRARSSDDQPFSERDLVHDDELRELLRLLLEHSRDAEDDRKPAASRTRSI